MQIRIDKETTSPGQAWGKPSHAISSDLEYFPDSVETAKNVSTPVNPAKTFSRGVTAHAHFESIFRSAKRFFSLSCRICTHKLKKATQHSYIIAEEGHYLMIHGKTSASLQALVCICRNRKRSFFVGLVQ